jgi:hypothetical protein
MITTVNILDLLKEHLGSDYKTAKELNIPQSRISELRHKGGSLTDAQGLKAAQLLNFPEESIILSLAAERSMNSPAYKVLLDVADKYDPRKTAAVAALFIFTGLASFSEVLPTFPLL